MLDLRSLADEWQALLEDGPDACTRADLLEDCAKFADLCSSLNVEPADPDALRSQGENYESTLILETEFEDYARELAEDIGAVDHNAGWPMSCIDWKQAAEELQMDYTSITYDGDDYLMRS